MRQKDWTLSKTFLILLVTAAAAAAQEYQIRTRVDLVVVPVTLTLTSSDNRLVTGLGQKDFQILESGRPQTISSFSIDPVPLSAAVLLDMGLSGASFVKIRKTVPALCGAFSEFDEFAVYRFDT